MIQYEAKNYIPDWIIGDVHGRIEVIEAAKKLDGKVMFVGDFLDSFTRSSADQIKCLSTLINYTKQGKWEFVIGNHEVSYMDNRRQCSGYNSLTSTLVMPIIPDIRKYGQLFWYNKDSQILITHAGLSDTVFVDMLVEQDDLETDLADLQYHIDMGNTLLRAAMDNSMDSIFYSVGGRRGGLSPVGGPLWCDLYEFEGIPGLTQIFGHTATRSGIWNEDTNWCIDTLDTHAEILRYNRSSKEFCVDYLDIRRKSR